jgi:lysyl-tRNA synthetase class 2
LLAAGETRVVNFARVFRNRERGDLHHPEFTMLEWYRTNETYDVLMDDCAALLGEAARAAGAKEFRFRGKTVDPFAAPERLTVADAFARYAEVDLLSTVSEGRGDRAMLAAEAARIGVTTANDDTWGDIFSRILAERVDPRLGIGRATLLYEYPLPLAALARPKPGSDKVAERFELYACGVELANAFGELIDVAEQRARFETAMAEKHRIHGERYPVDEDFLLALGQMPPASGIALGFDRLVMLATGAQRIEQVIWAPVVDP